MGERSSNHDRLREAGLTNEEMEPSEDHVEAINQLSEDEVDALIRVHKKLRKSGAHQRESAYIVPEGGRFPRC